LREAKPSQKDEAIMSDKDINAICNLVKMNGRYSIGRNYKGSQKLKVPYGPFGIFAHRFKIDTLDLLLIRQELANGAFH
jgi:hypothetical protein